jgi:hypothetical protein
MIPRLPTPEDRIDPGATERLACELRCTRCGRTAMYDVPSVTIHPDIKQCEADGWDGILLGRIIECRGCGAEDQYAVSPLSTTAMLLRLLAGSEGRRGRDAGHQGRIVIGIARLWDGTQARRPSQALAHLRELTQQQPENGEAWRRLGNYCERYERMGQAEDAWRMAIKVDRTEFEATFSLAKLHFDADRPAQGFAFLRQAFERLPQAKGMASDFRDTVADRMVEFLRGTLECTNEPIALMACWSGARVGGEQVVHASSVDLRKVRGWDRLVQFIAGSGVLSLSLTPDLPTDGVTQLDALLHAGGARSRAVLHVRSSARVERNDPCPCGSGKKFKKCCLDR